MFAKFCCEKLSINSKKVILAKLGKELGKIKLGKIPKK